MKIVIALIAAIAVGVMIAMADYVGDRNFWMTTGAVIACVVGLVVVALWGGKKA